MNLFLLTLFPLSLIIFYFKKDRDNRAHFIPVIFTGFFTGILFIAYKLLFSSLYFIPHANVGINFLYYFFSQILIPTAVIYGLFFLLSRKDTIRDRFSFFFPVVAGFYTTFLPYFILETQKPYPGFLLFLKPIMFLAMFIIVHIWINKIIDSDKNANFLVAAGAIIFAALCIPALTEAMWVVNLMPLFWIIPAVALIAYAVFLIFPKDSNN